MEPIELWTSGEANTAAKHNRHLEVLRKMASVLGANGVDVLQTMGGTTLTPQEAVFASRPVVVQITSAKTPGGLYGGTIVSTYGVATTTGKLDPESAATSLATLVTMTGTDNCYFIHVNEYGTTNHDLTDANNEAAGYGVGVVSDIPTTDGRPVIVGVAFPFWTCES